MRWQSGRMRRSRKPLNLHGFREFESHPHRQNLFSNALFSSARLSENVFQSQHQSDPFVAGELIEVLLCQRTAGSSLTPGIRSSDLSGSPRLKDSRKRR